MSDTEAIKILGLDNTFSYEDEQMAYSSLVEGNHPNLEKIKEAHEYLTNKYFNDNNYPIVTIDDNIPERNLIDELKYLTISHNSYPEEYKEIIDNIARIYEKYASKLEINKEDFSEIVYSCALYEIKEQFTSLAKLYFKNNKINYKLNNLDYNLSLDEFWEELERVKSNEEEKAKFKEILSKNAECYQNYIGYDDVMKTFIEVTIEQTVKSIMQNEDENKSVYDYIQDMNSVIFNGFGDRFKERLGREVEKYKKDPNYNEYIKLKIYDAIEYFNVYAKEKEYAKSKLPNIMNKFYEYIDEIFNDSASLSSHISALKERFLASEDYIKDAKIAKLYERLILYEKQFNSGKDIFDDIKRLEEELNRYESVRKTLKDNYNEVTSIYHDLIRRYYEELNKIDISNNYEEAAKLSEIFKNALDLFKKLESGEIDTKVLLDILSKISFTDYNSDHKLLRIKTIKTGVYLKNLDYMNDDENFYYLKEEDGEYYLYHTGLDMYKIKVYPNSIYNKYVPLDEFLSLAEYVGKEAHNTLEYSRILVLYKLGNVSVLKNEFNFMIGNTIIDDLKEVDDYNIYGGKYDNIKECAKAITVEVERLVRAYDFREDKGNKN